MESAAASGRRASLIVFAVFVLNGFTMANWLARIPTVRDELHLEQAELGLIILIGSLGSVLSMPATGKIISALGARRTVTLTAAVAAFGLTVAVLGVSLGITLVLAIGLFVATSGIGGWDVAMNFAGTQAERALGKAIMPAFHGGFSIGTVLGAAVGAGAIHLHISVAAHIIAVVVVAWLLAALLARHFLPASQAESVPEPAAEGMSGSEPAAEGMSGSEPAAEGMSGSEPAAEGMSGSEPAPAVTSSPYPTASADSSRGRVSYLGAWIEPRTLLIGVVVLAAALTEGAANDWLALAVIDGFNVPNAVGAYGLSIFLVGMTAMRFTGTWLLDRFGRVAILRLCTGLALVGLATFTLAPSLPLALVGAIAWGMGAALGFPVGMSAASDDPARAAARLSVVSTVGYAAFLIGPGALGFLAQEFGTRHALMAIMVPLVLGLAAIGATREGHRQPKK